MDISEKQSSNFSNARFSVFPGFRIIQIIYFYRKYYLSYLFIIALTITFNIFYSCMAPIITKNIFDALFLKNQTYFIVLLFCIQGIGLMILFGSDIVQAFCASKIGVSLVNFLKFKMFNKVQHMNFSELGNNRASEVISNFTTDLEQIEFVASHNIWNSIRAIFFLIPGVILLIHFNWQLSLLVILITPLSFLFPKLTSKKTSFIYDRNQKQQASIIRMVQESIVMQSISKLLLLTRYKRHIFKDTVESTKQLKSSFHALIEITGRTVYLTMNFTRFIIMVVGVYMIIVHRITIGELIGFIELLGSVNYSINTLSSNYALLLKGEMSLSNIEDILEYRSQKKSLVESKIHFETLREGICFINVCLNYGEREILKNINLSILPNQYIAIVGPSGCGKSTILKLILQEILPCSGEILIDNVNIKKIQKSSFLEKVGIVLQSSMLFDTSVKENIRMGKLDATEEEIILAAVMSEINEDILKFTKGYDEDIGIQHSRLSGGQAQRIALARALVKNPPILILDEATSALDPLNAAAIDQMLMKIKNQYTVIYVTHRLSSTINADKIFVMDNGRIIESGTHKTLLSEPGTYAKLWFKQHVASFTQNYRHAYISSAWLKSIPLFEKLDNEIIKKLTELFVIEVVEADKIIFDEGDRGDKFYVIASGSVTISRKTINEQRQIIAELSEGDYFGEISLLKDKARNARVETKVASIFLILYSQQFSMILHNLPEELREFIEKKADEHDIINSTDIIKYHL